MLLIAAIVVSATLVPWLGAGVVGAASCTTVTGGTTITDSGCYVLADGPSNGEEDEEDNEVSPYVDVQASDVVLDGNGTTVGGAGSGEAIRVGGTHSNVTVRNVTLTDWATGVYVRDADAVTVEDVTVRSGGTGVTVDTTTNATVRRVTASNNTDYGVYLKASPGGVLSNVTADGNTKSDVLVDSSDGVTIRDTTLVDAGEHGLFLKNSPNASVVGVTVEAPVLDGIRVDASDGAVVRDSTARRAGQHGVHVTDSKANASVRNVTATNSTGHGFLVHHSDGSDVAGNTARDSGAAGIRVSSELTTVRDNRLERNADGVYLYRHSHVVENNTVRENGYGVTLDGDNTTVAHNRVVGSTTAGFRYASGKDDLIYDNLFNNSKNTEYSTDPDPSNRWNVSTRAGTNVLGGSVVGGNAWFDPSGDGHSELWDDADDDGIVDSNYTVFETSVDERPLNAVDSALTVAPASHDYGSVNLSSNRTREFLVESRARPNVTVDRLSVEGPDATSFALESDPTPVTLSTGETVSVNVTFDPTATGLLAANLRVESDTTGVSGVNATLAGEGVDDTAPTADAGPNRTVDDGSPVSFDGTNSIDDEGVVSYEWDFGDGTTATGPTPSHTYSAPGTYAVALNASDGAGNTDTDTATVTVSDVSAPTADAGPNRTVDDGSPVTFDGRNSTDNVDVVSYEWDFGDGESATSATPNHTYTAPGTYTVTLNASDAAGNLGTDALVIMVESTGSSDGSDDDTGDGGGDSDSGGGGGLVGGEPTGDVTVTERTLLNETTTVDDPVLVRVGLANYDPVRGLLELDLVANGVVVDEREVAVALDSERTVYLRTTFDRPGRYELGVNGVTAGTVEVVDATGENSTDTSGPVSPPPEDLAVRIDADGESSADVAVSGVQSNRSVPVEFGDEGPTADEVSFSSISFTPTETGPVTMNVTASRNPLPGAPEFDRTDNTSGLAHLRVEHSIANEDVDGATLRFEIAAARLERLETTPDDVALYRYQNGSWVELPTGVVGETDDGYVFVARSPGLSEFAAGAKQPQFELRTASVEVEEMRVGDEMRVLVRITNTGGADGTYIAKLLLDREVVGERQLTIASNGTRQARFNRQMGRPGTYRVLVNDHLAGDVVVAEDASRSTPTSSSAGDGRRLPLGFGVSALSVLAILAGILYRRY